MLLVGPSAAAAVLLAYLVNHYGLIVSQSAVRWMRICSATMFATGGLRGARFERAGFLVQAPASRIGTFTAPLPITRGNWKFRIAQATCGEERFKTGQPSSFRLIFLTLKQGFEQRSRSWTPEPINQNLRSGASVKARRNSYGS